MFTMVNTLSMILSTLGSSVVVCDSRLYSRLFIIVYDDYIGLLFIDM